MNVNIRKVCEKEKKAAVKLIRKLFNGSNVTIEDEDVVLIAESEGKPVGFIHLSMLEEYECLGLIKGLGVFPEYRRKGIGKTLLIKGLNELYFESGAVFIVLWVEKGNTPAVMFYKKNGFEIIKAVEHTYLMARWIT